MNKFNHSEFTEELQNSMNALVNCNHENANTYMEHFLDLFQSLVDKYAPLRKQSQKQLKLKSKPWMKNKNIQRLVKLKNSKFRKYIRSKTESSHMNYKRIRNKLTHITKTAKQTYYSNLFSSSYSNPRSLWKNIEKVIQFKNHQTNTIKFLEDADKNRTSDPRMMSNLFNDFFVKVGSNLAGSLPGLGGDRQLQI